MGESLKSTFLLILLLCLSCAKKSDDSVTSPTNIDMDKMRWNLSEFPIQLKVSANLDPTSQNIVSDVMDVWEAAANINFFNATETTPVLNFTRLSDYYYSDKYVNGVYLATNEVDELGADSLAVTQIFFTRSTDSSLNTYYHIIHTDIVLNGFHYDFSTDIHDNANYYLLTLVLHEMGHVLGLGHKSTGIMYPYMSTDDKQDSLSSYDIDLINSKYNPANSFMAGLQPENSSEVLGGEVEERILLHLPASRVFSNRLLANSFQKKSHE
jgi:hypothetical protein